MKSIFLHLLIFWRLDDSEKKTVHFFLLFQNDVCVGDGTLTGSNGDLSGNCYTSQECETLGGAPAGDCAEGYGVCCVCKFLSNFHYTVNVKM